MMIEINGVPVEFPFEPYASQVDYMRKVIEALDSAEHAVLESPTGNSIPCSMTATTFNTHLLFRHWQDFEFVMLHASLDR